ncbi:MAG: EamA/RhaT family transporter [Bacteroidetes bacterium]|nr:EamA/RhaT family transporter [Bacteroidota bacterium]
MLYIISTILISVLLLVIFKLFQLFDVNSFVAIIINYMAATITGILFLNAPVNLHEIINADWFKISLPLGAVFISIFYLISQTAQRIGIATASVANKMSVVIPVLFSIFYLHENLSLIKLCGIFLALIAVYLSTSASENNPQLKKLIWLPILVFIGSGLIDTTINIANTFYVKTKQDSALFSISTFASAFCIGLLLVIYQLSQKKLAVNQLLHFKNIFGGIALGIPNYFSIYFIFKSLDTKLLSSAQLFPVLNLCNVALAAILGWLAFKEKLSVLNVTGIILALISIILIAL